MKDTKLIRTRTFDRIFSDCRSIHVHVRRLRGEWLVTIRGDDDREESNFHSRFGYNFGSFFLFSLGGGMEVGQTEGSVKFTVDGEDRPIFVRQQIPDQFEALWWKSGGIFIIPHPPNQMTVLLFIHHINA